MNCIVTSILWNFLELGNLFFCGAKLQQAWLLSKGREGRGREERMALAPGKEGSHTMRQRESAKYSGLPQYNKLQFSKKKKKRERERQLL